MLPPPLRAQLDGHLFPAVADAPPVNGGFRISLVPYPEAVALMEAHVAAIAAGTAPEAVWLLEHPPLYTAGTSAHAEDLVDARFPPSSPRGAAGNTPIMVPASGSPM